MLGTEAVGSETAPLVGSVMRRPSARSLHFSQRDTAAGTGEMAWDARRNPSRGGWT